MKNSFFTTLVLVLLSNALVIFGINSINKINSIKSDVGQLPNELPEPMPVQPSEIHPVELEIGLPTQSTNLSKKFMNGYKDGWQGVRLGPIGWTLSDDYRQGHMLGSYDQKQGIDRYPEARIRSRNK